MQPSFFFKNIKNITNPKLLFVVYHVNIFIFTFIHLFLPVRAGVAICKFNGSSFRSHPRPAFFSCAKYFALLLDIDNMFLIYCFDYEHTGL